MYTSRYLKHYWRYRHRIHAVCGILAGVFTAAGFIIVMNWLGWAFYFDNIHNFAGIVFSFLTILLVLGGVTLLTMYKAVNLDWQTKTLLRIKRVHKWFGYFIVFTVQIAVMSGIVRKAGIWFWSPSLKDGLLIANIFIFFFSLLIGEIIH